MAARIKQKTHRGAAKRFKLTGAGYRRKRAYRSHIRTKMSSKRKRQLRGTRTLHSAEQRKVRRLLQVS